MDRSIYKMEIVEIEIKTTGQKPVKFPDQPNLKNVRIQSIEAYTPGTITTTPISYGTPMSIADMKNTFVTMQEGGTQTIQNKPLLSFNSMIASTDPYTNNPAMLKDKVFSWDKCFLTFGASVTASIVALEVWYDDSELYPIT